MTLPAHLKYVNDSAPGYTRRKWGKGFRYLNQAGEYLSDESELDRVKSLVIPPAWREVWICPNANGHLQCTGVDDRNRKQYLYHPDWLEYQQMKKFSRLFPFGRQLPSIRKQVETDLSRKSWPRKKVLALAVHLLDDYYLRVGNITYKRRNETYGLTTLRRKHLEFVDEGQLKLSYSAKSNKQRNISIRNKTLIRLIRQTSELPGYEVFRYLDESGNSCNIDSADVNEYIHSISGSDYTAKDFRTWAGTKLAVEYAHDAYEESSTSGNKKLEPTLVKMVAKDLGNTMAICRDYYIHPHILTVVKDPGFKEKYNDQLDSNQYLEESEELVMAILDKE